MGVNSVISINKGIKKSPHYQYLIDRINTKTPMARSIRKI